MQRALLCLVIAACSGNERSKVTPTVSEVRTRVGVPCERRYGSTLDSCGRTGGPLTASIFHDYVSEETVATAKVTSINISLEAASADAALARLHTVLDGIVPEAHFAGIRTRISGATAERFDQNKPPVVTGGVDVRSGTSASDPARPRFQVEIWYR
jgi:hypothetical protein